MKKFVSLILSLAFAGSTFAQMSGYSSSQSDGTTLGANETLTADGIALGNAVKLRGYVDFTLQRLDSDDDANDDAHTSADIDFLFDLSPVTGEVHLNVGGNDKGTSLYEKVTENNVSKDLLEQAFGRYSFNQDFHITFGRQVTSIGFDSDEATGRYAVTPAYLFNRKAYVDGVRLNYNNGMFGFIFGLHDHYGINQNAKHIMSLAGMDVTGSDHDGLDDGIAVDLAASVTFFPGLEARLGLANENGKAYKSVLTVPDPAGGPSATFTHDNKGNDDNLLLNGWLAWNPGDLTLAVEFDNVNGSGYDLWNLMLLANYRFSDFFATTLRYSHIDAEVDEIGSADWDRFTLALLFSITENFDINFEYSHIGSGINDDVNEFYLQALLTY